MGIDNRLRPTKIGRLMTHIGQIVGSGILSLAVLLGLASAPAAKTITVPCDSCAVCTTGYSACKTICDAVHYAAPGDTVVVKKGTYKNYVPFGSKQLTVKSEGGPEETIIEGGSTDCHGISGHGRVVFMQGNAQGQVLEGFTIRGGSSSLSGGGLGVMYGGVIRDCIITGNHSGSNGGGIWLQGASYTPNQPHYATLENSVVKSNSARGGGGGIWAEKLARVTNTVIEGNTVSRSGGSTNGGGGIFVYSGDVVSDVIIQGCTIRDNTVGTATHL